VIRLIPKMEYVYKLGKANHSNINSCFADCDSNTFVKLDDRAYCRITEDPKINGVWIHGLFSFEKGYGRMLLDELIKNYLGTGSKECIRLNCIGKKLRDYYESFGFTVFFEHKSFRTSSDKYYEMVLYKHDVE